MNVDVEALARTLGLGALLAHLRTHHGGYDLVDQWQQGEFHHDVILRVGGAVLVVSTNCNGGVKEVLAFDDVPDRWALWRSRCPDNADFVQRASTAPPLPAQRARAVTFHWFDPCALLVDDARSELKPACRQRAVGGGWEPSSS